MPLIIVSGYPASGKTTRVQMLTASIKDLIERSSNPVHKNLTVTIVNDESVGLSRSAYAEPRTEKDARAAFSSAVKRELGREKIVIADGMNYIKGFRYQMYCEAKAVQTPSCCLHVATTPEMSRNFNTKIEESDPGKSYPPDLLDNLIFRYEEPSGFARWDSPLFTLPIEDALPPAEAIMRAIVGGFPPVDGDAVADKGQPGGASQDLKRVRPNLATVAPARTDSDALQHLDRACAEVVKLLQDWQVEKGSDAESDFNADNGTAGTLALKIPAGGLSMPALQRMRREFVSLVRSNPAMSRRTRDEQRREFVGFINRRVWQD